jgi:hypothetical protein
MLDVEAFGTHMKMFLKWGNNEQLIKSLQNKNKRVRSLNRGLIFCFHFNSNEDSANAAKSIEIDQIFQSCVQ